MRYTIEQINEAWIAFTKPLWMFPKSREVVEPDECGAIKYNKEDMPRPITRTDFISFLIAFHTDKSK